MLFLNPLLWATNLAAGSTSPSSLVNALVAAEAHHCQKVSMAVNALVAETHHCQQVGMADIAWWCRGVQGWQRPWRWVSCGSTAPSPASARLRGVATRYVLLLVTRPHILFCPSQLESLSMHVIHAVIACFARLKASQLSAISFSL
jgi:hypothetical protein